MLKLILKFIFSLGALILLSLISLDASQSDPKIIATLIAALGVTVLTAVDLWEFKKSIREAAEKDAQSREKRLRDIQFNFANNYFSNLQRLEIFKDKAEITYERLYEMSQDESGDILLLNEKKLYVIIDELEEFAQLYTK